MMSTTTQSSTTSNTTSIPNHHQTLTICISCDVNRMSRWICQGCAASCHAGHTLLPAKIVYGIEAICKCGKCSHGAMQHATPILLHLPPPQNITSPTMAPAPLPHDRVDRRWDETHNSQLSDRVFELGALGGSGGRGAAPFSGFGLQTAYGASTRERIGAASNEWIADRQFTGTMTHSDSGNNKGGRQISSSGTIGYETDFIAQPASHIPHLDSQCKINPRHDFDVFTS